MNTVGRADIITDGLNKEGGRAGSQCACEGSGSCLCTGWTAVLVTQMMCVSGKSAAPFCACEVGNPSLLNGTGLFGSGAGSGEGSRLDIRF